MSNTLIDETKLYRNVRSGAVVRILGQSDGRVRLATFQDGTTGPSRTAPTASFHRAPVDSSGNLHATGYAPLMDSSQPVDETGPSGKWDVVDLIENMDSLSDEELTHLVAQQEKNKKRAERIAEKGKTLLKYRRGRRPGLVIQGSYTLAYSSTAKFDAKTAACNLDPADLQKILVSKPDSTMARAVFKDEPEKLALCLKGDSLSLTIRKTTDEDRIKFAKQDSTELASEDIEDFVM